ncbi:hypothetical protein AB3S75_013357 [Citrus x aurantiifolia]
MQAETNSLVPLHQFVPWVVVVGQPQYEEYENFIVHICKAYKSCLRVAATHPLSPTSMGSNRSLSFQLANKEITTLPTRISHNNVDTQDEHGSFTVICAFPMCL